MLYLRLIDIPTMLINKFILLLLSIILSFDSLDHISM